MRIGVDVQVAIDPETDSVSISLYSIPLKILEDVLENMSQPEWRQNIVDGVNGAIVAKDLGIGITERTFWLGPSEA